MRRERRRLHLVCFAPPELLGEPRRPYLRSGLGVLEEFVEPVIVGFVACLQRIVWPDRGLVDAIRLTASHVAGIGTIDQTLIRLRAASMALPATRGISWNDIHGRGRR